MSAVDVDAAGLYPGRVVHRRLVPPCYRFVYRVFYLLIDVDRVDEVAAGLRWFSHNGFNLLSLYDRDHGHGKPGGLRCWAEGLLRTQGIELDGGRIRLLSLPRVLGYAFNPISLWYCEHRDGGLRAVIAEVNNTFGERHSYLLASGDAGCPYQRVHEKDKCFHVSPFLDPTGRYRFHLAEPGASNRVTIHEYRHGEPILWATLSGRRKTLSDGAILRQVLAMPLMTLKVVAAIHWEALKIWLRGGKFHPRPAPPGREVS